ncbi:hypothetical protein DFP72DRAFT_815400 [Ephemerocybe angulata]|uniref:Uncharacterized protein n=1 Tax=Ephemerocybe angulata TaxID=980116 RepID=A0A8H6HTU3_9AGAR|nr:hypothetical protein DFP72DRAFT_815303 [Tulosesus angulatus]KAF6752519.1 hypothetical protein DFP72DRAFT_815400 [Tulosesus angulatus]
MEALTQSIHTITQTLKYNSAGDAICPLCGKPVPLGVGGLGNLTKQHMPSDGCKRARTKGMKSITSFFGKKTKAPVVPSTVSQPPLLRSAPLQPGSPGPSSVSQPACRPLQPSTAPPRSTLAVTSTLVSMLSTLHEPDGEGNDFLAAFDQAPENFDNPGLDEDELWEEVINPILHRELGWGGNDEEHQFRGVRRASVVGLVGFVEYFVSKRGLSEALFEMRMERVADGLKKRGTTVPPTSTQNTTVAQPSEPATPQAIVRQSTDAILIPDSDDEACAPPITQNSTRSTTRSSSVISRCAGYRVDVPPGLSPHSAYPFGLHDINSLPWSYMVDDGRLVLWSKSCSGGAGVEGKGCGACMALKENRSLEGIVDRMRHGTREGTRYAYLGISALIDALRHKNTQIEFHRLRALNLARKLATAANALSDFKRILSAVASKKVERLDAVIRVGLRQKRGVRHILGQCVKAVKRLYTPKDYTEEEYMKGVVLWRLGGDRIAAIAHRALGLPSVTTLRNQARIPPIIPSPGAPTVAEVSKNVEATFEPILSILKPAVDAPRRHAVLMFDELATEKRIRWDSKTNMLMGVCREHAHKVSLEFGSEEDMVGVFEAIDDGTVHYAGEATIGAVGLLAKDNRLYAARGVLISGDCKKETGQEHVKVIQTTLDGVNEHQDSTGIRVVSIASDGETRRGAALADLTFKTELSPESPIYPLLQSLPFMNMHVGDDDITADKDWKHVFKRLRNLLIRPQGIVVAGTRITPAILSTHFEDEGKTRTHIGSLLNPDDKQDVNLAFGLLQAIWNLPRTPTKEDTNPGYMRTREALWILGQFLFHTVFPYLCVDLTLSEQLEHLSAAAHLGFLLYRMEGKEFLPTLLYTDIMIMLKNVFFCVAKAKVDDPDGEFWIILLGTDRLEEIFGDLRTMIGNDANLDILQVSWRLGSTAEVANILAKYPHWDRPPPTSDHLKPGSWRASTKVRDVILQTVWRVGRRIVEKLMPDAKNMFSQLEQDIAQDPVNILAPNGQLLVKTTEYNEDTSEDDPSLDNDSPETPSPPILLDEDTPETAEDARVEEDDDDDDGVQLNSATATPRSSPPSFSKTLLIKGIAVLKSRLLSAYSKYRKIPTSVDRLKRIQHVQRFSPSTIERNTTHLAGSDSTTARLVIHDPVATILCCNGQPWLGLGEVRVDGQVVDDVSRSVLGEEYVSISFQMLGLRPARTDEDTSGMYDWRTVSYAPELTLTVPGRAIEAIDPVVASVPSSPSSVFHLLDSAFLVALAASLYGRLTVNDLRSIPKIVSSKHFPYREAGGAYLYSPFCTILLTISMQGTHASFVRMNETLGKLASATSSSANTATHLIFSIRARGLEYLSTWPPTFSVIPVSRLDSPTSRVGCVYRLLRCVCGIWRRGRAHRRTSESTRRSPGARI